MKKIKNIRQLKAEQQKLLQKQIRLEEKMTHRWLALKSSNKILVNTVSLAYSLLSRNWWAKAGKKWFDFLK